MKNICVFGIMLLSITKTLAQSAEIRADKGVVVPQFTTAYINGITSQSKGTVLFDKDLNLMKYWNGLAWIPVQNGASGTGWALSGDNIYNNNTGNVGIGTNGPSRKLEVNSGVNGESGINLPKMVGNLLSDPNFITINSPTGLAKDDDITIYISDFLTNKIYKLLDYNTQSLFLDAGLNGPHDLTIGPDGFLYVANFHGNYVLKVNVSNAAYSVFASGFSNPVGLTFDNSGNLYVSNYGNGTLSKVTSGGIVTHSFATGLTSPYGCVFDPISNKIFISNYGANEVAQINASTGGVKTTFKSNVDFCTGITRNGYGDIFVAQAGANKIVKINSQGVMSDYAATTYPFDIIFDNIPNRIEDIYVANQTINRVSRIYPNYYNSLLAVSPTGDIKKMSLAKNSYKLYVDNSFSSEVDGIYGEGKNSTFFGGTGVRGYSERGTGVSGSSNSNTGIDGFSSSGIGVRGVSFTGTAGYFQGSVQVTGNLCALNVSCPSDFRLKKELVQLSSSLSKLSSLKGYNYYWKDSTRSKNLQTGVIAQELQKVFPELVNEEKDGFLSVNYTGLIPHLLESIKELRTENENLNLRLQKLENLEKRLMALEANNQKSDIQNK